jgi:hypothetical protein
LLPSNRPEGSRKGEIRSLPDLASASQGLLPCSDRPEGSKKGGIRSLLDFASVSQGLLPCSDRPEGSRKGEIRSLPDLAEGPAVPAALASSIISFIRTQNQPFCARRFAFVLRLRGFVYGRALGSGSVRKSGTFEYGI